MKGYGVPQGMGPISHAIEIVSHASSRIEVTIQKKLHRNAYALNGDKIAVKGNAYTR
jgi:hypothetical protein